MTRCPLVALSVPLLTSLSMIGCTADEIDTQPEFRDACGASTLAENADFDTNPRAHGEVLCDVEAGEALVGILNQDYGWDSLDGIGALCLLPDGTTREVVHAGDLSNATPDPEPVWCPHGETVVGLGYSDANPWPGVPGDTTDAATVVCSGGGGPMEVADLEGNDNPLQLVRCPEGEVPVGFAYVDLDGPAYSDLTDAITLVCAPPCETCDPVTPILVANPDLDDNPRRPAELLCDEHETMVGILYRDYAWDSMDGAGVECENGLGHIRQVFDAGDMGNAPGPEVTVRCPTGRRVTSISYKDAERWPGVPGDTSDGLTVGCDGSAPLSNPDLDDNRNPFQTFFCPSGARAAGIQYVDLDGPAYSDLTDAISLVCRNDCSE